MPLWNGSLHHYRRAAVMAGLTARLLVFRSPIKKTLLPLTFLIRNKLHAAFFSSSCKNKNFSFAPPSQLPPEAKKLPFESTIHGFTFQDPFHWLSNTNDTDIISYLHRENSCAEAFMRDTEELHRSLYSEMVSRLPSKISTPPERWGPCSVFSIHFHAGNCKMFVWWSCTTSAFPMVRSIPFLCRKLAGEKKGWLNNLISSEGGFGRGQVLLGWNEIAEKHGYVHVGTCRVSPHHSFLITHLTQQGKNNFNFKSRI